MKQLKISIITILLILSNTYLKAQDTTITNTNLNQPNPFALRIHLSQAVTFYQADLNSATYTSDEESKLGSNYGVDFMYYYLFKGKLRASVSLGIAVTKLHSSRMLSYESSVWITDVDNQEVLVTEIVDNMFEKQKSTFLDIPLKIGFEYMLSNKVSAYISMGGTYGINLNGKYTNEAIITRNGYYPHLNVLLHDIDIEGSPYFYPVNKQVMSSKDLSLKNDIRLETVLGIKYEINAKLSALFGVKYMSGLSDVYDDNNLFMVNQTDPYLITYHSITSRDEKISTSGFGFEFALQLNIWKIFKK